MYKSLKNIIFYYHHSLGSRNISANIHLAEPPPICSIILRGKVTILPYFYNIIFYSGVNALSAVSLITIIY